MLAGGYSWRLFFYVEAAFAGALLIMAFFFVEESTYHRKEQPTTPISLNHSPTALDTDEKLEDNFQLENVSSISVPPRKSFLVTLKPWGAIDPDAEFVMTILRSFTYFLVPAVFWVIASYGMSSWDIGREWAYFWLIEFCRTLHWPRCFGIQLHFPSEDH